MDLDDPKIYTNFSSFKYQLFMQMYGTQTEVVAHMITTFKNHIKFHAAGKAHSRLY